MEPLSRPASLARKAAILFAVVVPLAATAYAIVLLWNRYVTWTDLAILGVMYAATAMGITIGYHRMLTHRGFDAPWPIRAFFLALASMAVQGPAIEWASTHVKHHAKADREGDPHSPLEGFWHAHFGWLFHDPGVEEVYTKPFQQDRLVVFFDRTFWVWVVLGFAIPYAVAGWSGLLWGGLVRVALVHHVTWSVNSVCHTFGKRPFETKDESRNEWIVGLLAFGEGWHNNHHAQPSAAIHGFRWWQFDMSGYVIRTLEAVGLARNVQKYKERRAPAPERAPAGDGRTTGGGRL